MCDYLKMKLALLITAALTAAHAARSDSALSGPSGITKHLNRAAHAARSDSAPSGPSGKIKHLIIMLMENHSFDNMLGWLKRNNTAINGLTGTEYNLANPAVPSSQKIYVTDQGAYRDPDPGHDVTSTAHGIYGTTSVSSAMEHNQSSVTMGGFAQAYQHAGYSIMDCMSPQHVPVISTLAMEFALFDAFFAGMPGPTFPNRLFAMSATSHGFADNDAGQTILGWPQRSIFDSVNASNSSWRVYFEDVATPWLLNNARSEFALEQCRGMDAFAVDAAAGDLPAFTWLDPSYFDIPGANATDQHPNHDVAEGERRIKYVYDALRASPLWNESALVITCEFKIKHIVLYCRVLTKHGRPFFVALPLFCRRRAWWLFRPRSHPGTVEHYFCIPRTPKQTHLHACDDCCSAAGDRRALTRRSPMRGLRLDPTGVHARRRSHSVHRCLPLVSRAAGNSASHPAIYCRVS